MHHTYAVVWLPKSIYMKSLHVFPRSFIKTVLFDWKKDSTSSSNLFQISCLFSNIHFEASLILLSPFIRKCLEESYFCQLPWPVWNDCVRRMWTLHPNFAYLISKSSASVTASPWLVPKRKSHDDEMKEFCWVLLLRKIFPLAIRAAVCIWHWDTA